MLLSIMRGNDLKNVLCWVDSTDRQDWIVKVGKALSDSCQGRCHAVMGLDCPSRVSGSSAKPAKPGRAPLTPEIIALAGKRLPGHPVAEIRRYARTRKVDLIIMGEQALQVERAYGERLIENAPCTVMILATPEPEKRAPSFEILDRQDALNKNDSDAKVTEGSQS